MAKTTVFSTTQAARGIVEKKVAALLASAKDPAARWVEMEASKKIRNQKYILGETSFGAYVRGQQHLKALEKAKSHQENAFVRHREDFHVGEVNEVKFKLEKVRNFSRPMNRLVCEGCHIQCTEADICMNDKLDHFKPGVGKVVITNMVHTGRRRNRNTG